MRKLLGLGIFVLWAFATQAQQDSLVIYGEVKQSLVVHTADLVGMKSVSITDFVVKNHTGEQRGEPKNMKGVLLKDALSPEVFASETPKELSRFYFVCTAADGYAVVFSWNELYNNALGDSVFLIVEKDGVALPEMRDRFLLVCTSDNMTGRRYVKQLSKIEVRKI